MNGRKAILRQVPHVTAANWLDFPSLNPPSFSPMPSSEPGPFSITPVLQAILLTRTPDRTTVSTDSTMGYAISRCSETRPSPAHKAMTTKEECPNTNKASVSNGAFLLLLFW